MSSVQSAQAKGGCPVIADREAHQDARRDEGDEEWAARVSRETVRRWGSTTEAALLDESGWPILENADAADLRLAFQAARGYAPYGNFVRAVLAGIYAER